MAEPPLSRLAGPIALVAGILVIASRLVILVTTPADIDGLKVYVLSGTHAVNSVVSITAYAFLALALVAIYEREALAAKTIGVVALAAAMIGTVFMAGDWWYEAFAVPRLAEVAPDVIDTFVGGRLLVGGVSSFVLFGLGWALFGAVTWRARVFPAPIAIAILIGGLLCGVPIGFVYLSGGVILGLAITGSGGWMRTTTGRASMAGKPEAA
jgi:uncharacterized membrane-anchored protein YitT (DUF2179 family)